MMIGKFIKKLLLLGLMAGVIYLSVLLLVDCIGMSDWAYKRFTVARQRSLIMGSSRAAQGIQPAVFNEYFKENDRYKLPIYNFSFTMSSSPYGETYFKHIEAMLMHCDERKHGLFILSVDPWALSEELKMDAGAYREDKECLGEISYLHLKPNLFYLIKYFNVLNGEWISSTIHLQDDGWLKIDANMEESYVAENVESKLRSYMEYKPHPSEYRLNWVCKTIELLQKYGDVYMCRIPVHPQMLVIENRFWENFDIEMSAIAEKYKIPYFNFTYQNQQYRTTDGNHLYKEDGAVFTKNLCDSIYLYIKQNIN